MTDTVPAITHESIKAARAALGDSQAAFASRFGVDQSLVARWENPELDVLPRGPTAILVEKFFVAHHAGRANEEFPVRQEPAASEG